MHDAGSAVARKPDSSVSACLAMLITPSPLVLTKNTFTSALASTLCKTPPPPPRKGPHQHGRRECDRIAFWSFSALGAPIAPYGEHRDRSNRKQRLGQAFHKRHYSSSLHPFVPKPGETDDARAPEPTTPRRVSTRFVDNPCQMSARGSQRASRFPSPPTSAMLRRCRTAPWSDAWWISRNHPSTHTGVPRAPRLAEGGQSQSYSPRLDR